MGPEGHSFCARRGTDVLKYPWYQMFGILAQRFAGLRHVNRRQGRVAILSGVAYLLLSSSSVPQQSGNQGADTASGQLVFNNSCRTCHSTKEGDNRLGPHLEKIIGRKARSSPLSVTIRGCPRRNKCSRRRGKGGLRAVLDCWRLRLSVDARWRSDDAARNNCGQGSNGASHVAPVGE